MPVIDIRSEGVLATENLVLNDPVGRFAGIAGTTDVERHHYRCVIEMHPLLSCKLVEL
jgi:hypothetical protein